MRKCRRDGFQCSLEPLLWHVRQPAGGHEEVQKWSRECDDSSFLLLLLLHYTRLPPNRLSLQCLWRGRIFTSVSTSLPPPSPPVYFPHTFSRSLPAASVSEAAASIMASCFPSSHVWLCVNARLPAHLFTCVHGAENGRITTNRG